jgi:N-acetylglucosaminyl-diphospho-decaprenol L-rhamnosyltransferase
VDEDGAGVTDVSEITAVLVSWNVRDLLLRCIASLKADGITKIVVIDNASKDDSVAAVRAHEPDVDLVALDHNTGFGGGVNRAIARTSSELVLVTTPDVLVEPGSTKVLLAAIESAPDIGLVAPQIKTPDGVMYPSVRRFPSLLDATGHAFLHFLWPSNPFSRRYKMVDWDHGSAADVDWVACTHLLVRREAWDAVHGFDEQFFMFVEDVDLCWRLHEAGWRVRYEPAAVVEHEISASADQTPYRMIAVHHRSIYRFNRKRAKGWRRALLPVIAVALTVRCLLAWVQRAVRRRPHAAA